jgi:hypothetical protein
MWDLKLGGEGNNFSSQLLELHLIDNICENIKWVMNLFHLSIKSLPLACRFYLNECPIVFCNTVSVFYHGFMVVIHLQSNLLEAKSEGLNSVT